MNMVNLEEEEDGVVTSWQDGCQTKDNCKKPTKPDFF